MKIQAFRRRSESTHEIGGVSYLFAKSDKGDFVANVDNEEHAERFIEIDEAFREYEPEAKPAPAASKFVVREADTGVELDLKALDNVQLRHFIAENDLSIADNLTGNKLRQAIIDALKA